ncbi:hypothetical protein M0E87_09980 [Corynebacterium sp. CCM 9185]|uniref:Uncharacterized protein n=1 Tax=Corynebacterium marambiense TaxID=2765364 RepID=A0ABS0VXJ6_9CORY|nr:hypothetical protein [Corynebacterium marambiense]MBI9001492.1 hypothetical protein [Corynebacterium marambiense]MCK7663985.1 hypothetical protein [Corynebacterium marambiense]MCX7543319.1 hypothetical protein [Corynebacterium marambiense]
MDSSLIGLIGIVFGSFFTFLFQELRRKSIESTSGRRVCRGALRLLITDFHKAIAVTEHEVEFRELGPECGEISISGYDDNAMNLALYLDAESWKLVEGGQLGVRRINGIRAQLRDEKRLLTDDELQSYFAIREHIKKSIDLLDPESVAPDLNFWRGLRRGRG